MSNKHNIMPLIFLLNEHQYKTHTIKVLDQNIHNGTSLKIISHCIIHSLTLVLWIVVLLEAIPIWEVLLNKRQEGVTQNSLHIKFLLHDSSEDENASCTSFRNTTPHMNLVGMFNGGLQLGQRAFLAKADLAMAFDPDTRLVRKHDIVEVFTFLQTPFAEC